MNLSKILSGIKYSLIFSSIITVIIFVIWFYLNRGPLTEFPIATVTLGIGGILLTTAGCIGPGRYKKVFDLVIYSPKSGSTFSEEILVSGFTLDNTIKNANIVVNEHEVGKITFTNYVGQVSIPREAIVDTVVNSIWLESKGKKSNKSFFTLFDYHEDLTDDEIDEFIKLEESTVVDPIEEVRAKYIKNITSGIGSISWGIFISSLILFLIGITVDFVIKK